MMLAATFSRSARSRSLPQVRAGAQAPPLADLIDDLVAGNHILAQEGILDGYGHISVRHPRQPRAIPARAIGGAGAR